MFFHSFFKISSELITIRRLTVMSARSLQENFKFSRNFIKIFQRPNQLISKYISNFLKMFAQLPQRRTERIIRGRGSRITKNDTSKFWVTNINIFFCFSPFFLIFAPLEAQHWHSTQSFHKVNPALIRRKYTVIVKLVSEWRGGDPLSKTLTCISYTSWALDFNKEAVFTVPSDSIRNGKLLPNCMSNVNGAPLGARSASVTFNWQMDQPGRLSSC